MNWEVSPKHLFSRRDCVKLVLILLCRALQRNHVVWRVFSWSLIVMKSISSEITGLSCVLTSSGLSFSSLWFSENWPMSSPSQTLQAWGHASPFPSGGRGVRGDTAHFTADGACLFSAPSSLPLEAVDVTDFPQGPASVPLILSGVFLSWLYFLLSFFISFLLPAWGLFCCSFPNFLRFWNFSNLWVYCYTFPIQLCLSCSPYILICWFRVFQICYG